MFVDRRAWRSPERDDRNFCQGYILQGFSEYNSSFPSSYGCGAMFPNHGFLRDYRGPLQGFKFKVGSIASNLYRSRLPSPMNHLSIFDHDCMI